MNSLAFTSSPARPSRYVSHEREEAAQHGLAVSGEQDSLDGCEQQVQQRGRATINFNMRYVGQRHDAAFLGLSIVGPSPQFLSGRSVDITVNPAYTVSWLGGEVRVNRNVAAYLRIDNLTDAVYESVLGYPALPRSCLESTTR